MVSVVPGLGVGPHAPSHPVILNLPLLSHPGGKVWNVLKDQPKGKSWGQMAMAPGLLFLAS